MTSKSKVKGIIEAKRKAIFANKAQIRKTALVDADLIADGKTIVAKFKNNNEKQEWIDSEIKHRVDVNRLGLKQPMRVKRLGHHTWGSWKLNDVAEAEYKLLVKLATNG